MTKVNNQPTKDQEKSVRLTTLKHGYHKPYQNDWKEASVRARAKIFLMWHFEREKV